MGKKSETICILRKIEKNILLPGKFYDMIVSKAKNVVAIIPEDLRKIVLFPTNAEMALFCRIDIKKASRLDDSFFIELRNILAEHNLKTLYTTGVCYSQDECYWEGVFEYKEGFPLEDFRKSLGTIKSVVNIEMNILHPIQNEN